MIEAFPAHCYIRYIYSFQLAIFALPRSIRIPSSTHTSTMQWAQSMVITFLQHHQHDCKANTEIGRVSYLKMHSLSATSILSSYIPSPAGRDLPLMHVSTMTLYHAIFKNHMANTFWLILATHCDQVFLFPIRESIITLLNGVMQTHGMENILLSYTSIF